MKKTIRVAAAGVFLAFPMALMLDGAVLSAQQPRPGGTAGIVTGEIQTLDGTPAVGVRIAAQAAEQNISESNDILASLAVTDSAGRYRLEDVPPGRYYIRAGYLESPTFFPGVVTDNEAHIVEVTAGATVSDVNFRLMRSAGVQVKGRIKEFPRGLPPDTVRLSLRPPRSLANLAIEVTVQADGAFEFSKVPPEAYTAFLLVNGGSGAPLPLAPITVGERNIGDLELVMPPFLIGRVALDGGGRLPLQPAAGRVPTGTGLTANALSLMQVRARGISSEGQASQSLATVHSDGSFFLVPAPGEYRLGWVLPNGLYLSSVSRGSLNLLQESVRISSELAEGASLPIRVVLTETAPASAPPEFAIRGRIEGLPDRSSAQKPWVTILEMSTSQVSRDVDVQRVGEVQVRGDGSFELMHVPGGYWTIRAEEGNGGVRIVASGTLLRVSGNVSGIVLPNPIAPTTATVSPLQQAARPAVLPVGSAKLSGRMVVPNASTPLPQEVEMGNGRGLGLSQARARVGSDGTFSFGMVSAGTYTLSPVDAASGPSRLILGGVSVTVVENQDVTVELVAPEIYTLNIRYLFEGGSTLPTDLARIQLQASYGSGGRLTLGNKDGRTSLLLHGGEYSVSIVGLPKTYTVNSISYGDIDLRKTPLSLGNSDTSDIVVRISPFPPKQQFTRVAGKVRNLPPQAFIQDPKVLLARTAEAGGGELSTTVGPDGSFEFKNVLPGLYTLSTFGLTSKVSRTIEVGDLDISDATITLTGIDNLLPGPGSSTAAFFRGDSSTTLQGVVTQKIEAMRPSPPAPASYFRMEVPDSGGIPRSWAIRLDVPRTQAAAQDLLRIKVGTQISVVIEKAIDGTNMGMLRPIANANTSLGINIEPD